MPTTAKVQVIEHKKEQQGHYSVLYKIVEPSELTGRYFNGATWRTDLVRDANGHLYEVGLNFTQVAMLKSEGYKMRPLDYTNHLPPPSKGSDFFETARRLD
jgi:hypothetical protein